MHRPQDFLVWETIESANILNSKFSCVREKFRNSFRRMSE